METKKKIKTFQYDEALTKKLKRAANKFSNTGAACEYLTNQKWFKPSMGLTGIDFIRLNNSFGADFGIGICDGELKPILMETKRC